MQWAGYVWPNGHEFDSANWLAQQLPACRHCAIHADLASVEPCHHKDISYSYEKILDWNLKYIMAPDLKAEEEEVFQIIIRSNRRLMLADVLNRPEYEPGFWVNPGL